MNPDLIHICLLEPENSRNIGSVARVMSNFGFKSLQLCNPVSFDRAEAAITACWAEQLLDQVQIKNTLEEMLSPMEEVVGFTSTVGRNWTGKIYLDEWVASLADAPARKTALLFGPEASGLSREHLMHCSKLVRIPSAEENPSLNLSHAVGVALYELARTRSELKQVRADDAPTWNEYYQLDRLVDQTLLSLEFERGGEPGPVPAIIKSALRRSATSKREIGLLLALFNKMNTELERRATKS